MSHFRCRVRWKELAPQYIRCLFAVSPPCHQRLPTVSQSAVSPGGLYSPRGPYGTPPAPPQTIPASRTNSSALLTHGIAKLHTAAWWPRGCVRSSSRRPPPLISVRPTSLCPSKSFGLFLIVLPRLTSSIRLQANSHQVRLPRAALVDGRKRIL